MLSLRPALEVTVSSIVLVASLAAVAAALIGAQALAATAATPSVSLRFATVTSAGSLVAAQSQGAVSAARATRGKFKIIFDDSLSRCAVAAASGAGNTSTNTFTYSTRIATYISGSTLYVTLMGQNDGPADYNFSVVLACTP